MTIVKIYGKKDREDRKRGFLIVFHHDMEKISTYSIGDNEIWKSIVNHTSH